MHVADAAIMHEYVARNLHRRLGIKIIQEIVSRYNAGEHTTNLSREFGISKSGLIQLLRGGGVKLRKQPMTPDDSQRAARFYQSEVSISEVVEQIGFTYSTVRKSLHRSGVAMRPKGVKRSSL